MEPKKQLVVANGFLRLFRYRIPWNNEVGNASDMTQRIPADRKVQKARIVQLRWKCDCEHLSASLSAQLEVRFPMELSWYESVDPIYVMSERFPKQIHHSLASR